MVITVTIATLEALKNRRTSRYNYSSSGELLNYGADALNEPVAHILNQLRTIELRIDGIWAWNSDSVARRNLGVEFRLCCTMELGRGVLIMLQDGTWAWSSDYVARWDLGVDF